MPMVKKKFDDKLEMIKYIKRKEEIRKLHASNFSLWCTELYRLSTANKVFKA